MGRRWRRKLNQIDSPSDLSGELAALLAASGRLFTLIRARTWDAEQDTSTGKAVIEDIMSWSDAAHNLSSIGAGILQNRQDDPGKQADFQRELTGLTRALEATAERAERRSQLVAKTLRDAATIVTRVADQTRSLPEPFTTGSVQLVNAHDRDVGSKLLLDGEEIGRADYDSHGSAGLELLVSMARNIARVTGRPLEMVEVDDDAFDPEP